MHVNKQTNFLNKNFMAQRGASMLEVILAVALVLMLVPFMYYHIADMNNTVKDVALANQIVKLRDPVVDFVRVNQSEFSSDDGSAVQFTAEELASIAPLAQSGWVFRNNMVGGSSIEVYLLFSLGTAYRTANIAKYIGSDAALVSDDNIAYSNDWAVSFDDDLTPGDLVFKITHDFSEADNDRYLHRGTIGGAHLNRMERTLNMNFNNLYNVKNISVPNPDGCSEDVCCDGDDCGVAYINSAQALFLNAGSGIVNVNNATFSSGAEIKTSDGSPHIGKLTVLGDVDNLKEIDTKTIDATAGMLYAQNISLSGNIEIGNNLSLGIDKELNLGETSALILNATYLENLTGDGVFNVGFDNKGGEVAISSDTLPEQKNYEEGKGSSFVMGQNSGILKYSLYKTESGEIIVPNLSIPQDYHLKIQEMDPYMILNTNPFNDVVQTLNI